MEVNGSSVSVSLISFSPKISKQKILTYASVEVFQDGPHIGQVELIPVNMCSENLPDHGGIEGWFPTFQTWRILFPTLLPNHGSCALAKGTSEMAAGNPLGIRL